MWNILHESYRRIDGAEQYALKLKRDVHEEANNSARLQYDLKQCQEALATSCAKLEEERLDYGAVRVALGFELESHKETIEVLERVFDEARKSGELADNFSRQIAMLRSKPVTQIAQAAPKVEELMATPLTKNNVALLNEITR